MTATNRGSGRDPRDFYRTPKWAVEALLGLEDIRGNILDPGCGDGAILSVLSEREDVEGALGVELDPGLASRAVEAGALGRLDVVTGDFLEYAEKVSPHRAFDAVVGNPPYRLAADFARASLGCVRPGGKVALLLRLNFLGSSRKRLDLVGTGSALVHVVVLSRRPSFTGDGKTDATDYAWFVWEVGGRSPTRCLGIRVTVVGPE